MLGEAVDHLGDGRLDVDPLLLDHPPHLLVKRGIAQHHRLGGEDVGLAGPDLVADRLACSATQLLLGAVHGPLETGPARPRTSSASMLRRGAAELSEQATTKAVPWAIPDDTGVPLIIFPALEVYTGRGRRERRGRHVAFGHLQPADKKCDS